MKRLLFSCLFILSAAFCSAEDPNTVGRAAYIAQCARCHGVDGKGNGSDAQRLYVAPRDLTSGRFKFKTTESGQPPSDDDLMQTLNRGLPGSGMPSFSNLETDVKKAIIQYIKSFSTAFSATPAPEVIARPANEKNSPDLKKGEEIYKKLQCALCHGEGGRANGTSALTLVDAWGKPIRPANLTQPWTYRGGSSALDIYYRMMAGLDGAPMPSYDGAVTKEDAWQLSNYVVSMYKKENWRLDLPVQKETAAQNLEAVKWDKITPVMVNLQTYHYERGQRVYPRINAVSVQAVQIGDEIGFRLAWDDASKDESGLTDGIMIAVKPEDFKGEARANLHTLYTPEAPPLQFWMWQASDMDTVRSKTTNLFNVARAGSNGQAKANAQYTDGQWVLVFSTKLKRTDSSKPIPLGFSAWDGNSNETPGRGVFSQWILLNLHPKDSEHH